MTATTSARLGSPLLAGMGLAALVLGYGVLPWGGGDSFLGLRSDVFADQWEDADLNRKLQEAFGIWGFALLIVLGIASFLVTRRQMPTWVHGVLAVLMIGGIAWHQGMIGTVNGLGIFARLPQLGAFLSALGLITKTGTR